MLHAVFFIDAYSMQHAGIFLQMYSYVKALTCIIAIVVG
jgi:hypothetical protein